MKKSELLKLKSKLEADIASIDRVLDLLKEAKKFITKTKLLSPVEPSLSILTVPKNGFIEGKTIQQAALELTGNFSSGDVEEYLLKRFPDAEIKDGSISTVLFSMKRKGLIGVVSEREGRNGAIYAKK